MRHTTTQDRERLLNQQRIRARCFHPTGTFMPFPKEAIEQSIPERFEHMVRLYPDCLAVQSPQRALTYAELNQAANRVAHAILSRCAPETETVAMLFEQSVRGIAAFLGILKARKICVPLDPSFPLARLSSILENAQASLILTNDQHFDCAHRLGDDPARLLNIDDMKPDLPCTDPGLAIAPDTLAWLLYTSGSTGNPKGVSQTHRNVLHLVMTVTNNLHLSQHDRLSLVFALHVNAGAHNIFYALLNGAGLYLLDVRREGLAHLADWFIQQDITVCKFAVTTYRHFVATLTGKEHFPKLRLIYLGSEPLYKTDVALYKTHFADTCLLLNRLGSTETGSLRMYFIDKHTDITGTIVPVGYPVEDNDVLLLDADGREVGVNEIGEIAVKSDYLSPGYWQRPDLTEAVFRPAVPGGTARIYCTGDLGIMRPDGCLEHLGRKDFQVKIRGYRIETAEIELALRDLESVQEAIVMARQGTSGEQRLVAYIVSRQHSAPTTSALREALAQTLPRHMIPSSFVIMEAFPLASSGKVAYGMLPVPDHTRPELHTPFIAPRTPVEDIVAQVWAEVLELDEVGIHDAFLDLGGDSLLATQVLSRLRTLFPLETLVHNVLEAATVAEMSHAILNTQSEPGRAEKIARAVQRVKNMSLQDMRDMLAEKRNDGA